MIKYFFFCFTLFFATVVSSAEIYVQPDNSGTVTYSDTPLNSKAQKIPTPKPNAYVTTKVEVPATVVTTEKTVTTTTATTAPVIAVPTGSKLPYTTFLLDSPKNQESIQNQPELVVSFKVDPPLQENDKIQVFVDGKAMGAPMKASSMVFPQVDRGTHQISATLVDGNGTVLKRTDPITVFVHQASVNSILNANRPASP